jgi:hypothetical protein
MVGVKQEETGLYLSPCGILNGGTAGFLEAPPLEGLRVVRKWATFHPMSSPESVLPQIS